MLALGPWLFWVPWSSSGSRCFALSDVNELSSCLVCRPFGQSYSILHPQMGMERPTFHQRQSPARGPCVGEMTKSSPQLVGRWEARRPAETGRKYGRTKHVFAASQKNKEQIAPHSSQFVGPVWDASGRRGMRRFVSYPYARHVSPGAAALGGGGRECRAQGSDPWCGLFP